MAFRNIGCSLFLIFARFPWRSVWVVESQGIWCSAWRRCVHGTFLKPFEMLLFIWVRLHLLPKLSSSNKRVAHSQRCEEASARFGLCSLVWKTLLDSALLENGDMYLRLKLVKAPHFHVYWQSHWWSLSLRRLCSCRTTGLFKRVDCWVTSVYISVQLVTPWLNVYSFPFECYLKNMFSLVYILPFLCRCYSVAVFSSKCTAFTSLEF